ncbi:glucosaminidase domain-containing protein [Brevibacillus composti]|uniref:Glucosaminidase domain-containing protein n=1 Tax=Brevibacillus composti TaxID=2796470 RepID=A0A7T5JQ11_9BACL|nr:glucosaminidase domain-containing protein [Brevibacillus composti]QQE75737.1 glucosaminidase domain-containing protein [Brevibacillus composti]QUO42763.1 glucosaminidase domain-containing protein [Brevibacillus composti]
MPESKQEKVIKLLSTYVVGKYPCPSGVIAQLIQECGWDLKTPKDIDTGRESYNLGNIKGVGPAGSVTIWTNEYYNGVKTRVKAKFRAYYNYGEAIDDHLSLLKKPRYVNAGVLKATDPRSYAEALQRAGYATDPQYANNIMRIVNQYNLTRFDKLPKNAEQIAKEAEEAVMKALEEWQLELAERSIDNLARTRDDKDGFILQNAEDWKKRLRENPQSVLEDMPWLVFVLLDRATKEE